MECTTKPECAKCMKPAARACSGCNGVVDENAPSGTYYCSFACEKGDKGHKVLCSRLRDRLILYRIAATAQKLWYVYRELTWIRFKVERVEKLDGNLILRGKITEDAVWPKDYEPFPIISDPHDRASALSFLGDLSALQWMVDFIDGMLDGIVTDTKAIEVTLKNMNHQTRIFPVEMEKIEMDKKRIHHAVLKVTLRSGEVFALDLSGAQYGHHNAVTPWAEFHKSRVHRTKSVTQPPLSQGVVYTKDYSIDAMSAWSHKEREACKGPLRVNSGNTLALMNFNMMEWQYDGGISLKELWRFPEKKYAILHANLMDYIEWKLENMGLGFRDKTWFTVKGKALAAKYPDYDHWPFIEKSVIENL